MISMSSLWQEVQNQIPHISFETTFSKVLPVCANDVIKISKIDFSATISNFNAQFTPLNKGLKILHQSGGFNNFFESTSGMRE